MWYKTPSEALQAPGRLKLVVSSSCNIKDKSNSPFMASWGFRISDIRIKNLSMISFSKNMAKSYMKCPIKIFRRTN